MPAPTSALQNSSIIRLVAADGSVWQVTRGDINSSLAGGTTPEDLALQLEEELRVFLGYEVGECVIDVQFDPGNGDLLGWSVDCL